MANVPRQMRDVHGWGGASFRRTSLPAASKKEVIGATIYYSRCKPGCLSLAARFACRRYAAECGQRWHRRVAARRVQLASVVLTAFGSMSRQDHLRRFNDIVSED